MTSPTSGPPPAAESTTYVFAVTAQADPGVMPRVLEQFAKRSLVPSRWYSAVSDAELQIDVRVDGLAPSLAGHIRRSLEALVNVRHVVTARA